MLIQNALFKCCHHPRKKVMSGSPRKQSGLLFNASDTTVVTITELGMYGRNKSASLHFVLWGMHLHCSLLRGRV